uniref:Uncharacterized protein n=2 Tax=Lygus hesperus TaxID=30085 RepID=A0A146KT97_LYGHE
MMEESELLGLGSEVGLKCESENVSSVSVSKGMESNYQSIQSTRVNKDVSGIESAEQIPQSRMSSDETGTDTCKACKEGCRSSTSNDGGLHFYVENVNPTELHNDTNGDGGGVQNTVNESSRGKRLRRRCDDDETSNTTVPGNDIATTVGGVEKNLDIRSAFTSTSSTVGSSSGGNTLHRHRSGSGIRKRMWVSNSTSKQRSQPLQ